MRFSILIFITLPLALFSLYSFLSEKKEIVSNESLEMIDGKFVSLEFINDSSTIKIHNQVNFTFTIPYKTTPLLDSNQFKDIADEDTLFVGFSPFQANTLITLKKNNTHIISYEDYENAEWNSLYNGSLGVFILCSILTVFFLLVENFLLPFFERKATKKFIQQLSKIQGIKETEDGCFLLIMNEYEILLNYEVRLTFNQPGNYNRVKVLIQLKEKHDHYVRRKMTIKKINSKYYVQLFQQVNFNIKEKKLIKKITEQINLIEAYKK